MRLVVIDASALVELLLRTERFDPVEAIVRDADADLHVPALCDLEVVAVLRRGLQEGRMDVDRAGHAVQDLLDLPLIRHGHQLLLERILELRDNFSSYDAAYVALAERLDAELLTADGALARAIRSRLDLRISGPR